MKPANNRSLPSNAETSPLANANSVTSKLKGLVQSAKNKWSAGSKAEADVVAQISGVAGGQELDRLAADAASVATTPVTPAAVEAIPSVAANIETPVYDQLAGTLQGLVSPADFSALVTDAPVNSVSSVSSSGLSTFANPMDMGPADLVLGQAPASGAGSAAGGAGSAAGAGGAASGAAAGTAAGTGAATAGAAAGAGAVAAGAGVAAAGVSTAAIVAGVAGVAAIASGTAKKDDTDTVAPTISSVAISSATGASSSTLNAGDLVTVTVTMNETVNVTGTPQLALLIGTTTVQASYASGSGSAALKFTYTILANQTDANGISIAANSLSLNSGTIKDAAGNSAVLSHGAVTDNANYLVDTTAPTAPTLALGTGVADGATSAEATQTTGVVTVNGESGSTIVTTFTNGSKTVSKTVTGTGSAQAVTLAADDLTTLGDGTITVSSVATDVAGNPSSAGTSSITLDRVAPTLVITSDKAALTQGQTATITYTFSEAPTGFAASDVVVTNGTLSDPVVSPTNAKVYTATFTPTADTSASASITVAASAYTDAAGNNGGAGITPTLSVETRTAASLIVADGYIDGAGVYIDMNDNGEIDIATDVLLGTSVNGTVNGFLTNAQKAHGLITSGGTDISTGLAFEGSYSATAGSLVVNPLTTLVQNMVLTTAGAQGSMSAADYLAKVKEAKASAITSVNSALGLATDADVTQIDTVSNSQSIESTTSAGITREQAIEMNSKAMMVANMMTLGAAAMKGSVADGSATAPSMTKLSNFMVQGIVSSINTAAASGGSVALGNSDSLKTILSTATDKAKTDTTLAFDDTKLTTSATTAATAVASTNSLIDTITGNAKAASATQTGASGSLTQILQAQKAALNQAADFKTGDSTKLATINTNFADASTAFTQALSQTGLKLGTTAVAEANLTKTAPTDTLAPKVTGITATPARAGDIAKFEVKMSEGVIVKFASDAYKPTLAIKTGDTTTGTAVFDPGLSTGDKLVFTYQVKTTDTLLSIAAGTSIVLPTNTADATKPTIIIDLAGNPATLSLATALTSFTAPTVDGNAPDIKVTATDAFVKAGASTTVTFEVSEKVATAAAGAFTIDDISVREAGTLVSGRVSDFKQLTAAEVTAKSLDANKVYYTAKITAGSAGAAMDVGVANGKFTDLAGNPNKPSNVAVIGIDGGSPSVSIVAGQSFFNKGNSGSTPSTTLTFNLSTASNDFTVEDITVLNGGTLSSFAKSTINDKIYTATLSGVTASTTVKVAKDAFAGTTGTAKNAESNTLGFKVDVDAPTVTIGVNNSTGTAVSSLKAGETASVVFTLSEAVVGFGAQSVRVSGGFLTDFKQLTASEITAKSLDAAKTYYTATFNQAPADPNSTAPAQVSINVDSGRFTDLAGNGNDTATPKTLTADNIKPAVVSVTDNVTGTANKATSLVNYTYTFNKAVSGLEASDFTAVNGTVGMPTTTSGSSGTVWVVPVTPLADKTGTISLTLKAEGVTDSSGNKNSVHGQSIQAIDTVAPTVTASIDRTSFKKDTTTKGNVTFTFSEDPGTSFTTDDITVTGGTIASLAKKSGDTSGKVWTAEFTPTSTATVTTGSIAVKANSYTDAAGNTGAATPSDLSLKINTLAPTVAISAASSVLKVGDTTVLTFTFSDVVTGFDNSDLTITGGTLGTVTKSSTDGRIYTATFTPSATSTDKAATIAVKPASYSFDNADGLAGTLSGGLKINQTVPTLSIALDSATADGNLVYKVTGSEAFDLVSSVSPSITNGAIVSTPTASSDRTTYLMTVKPTASGDVGVTIPAGAVTNGALTNSAAVTATTVKVALGTANADTLISGAGPEFIFPGAGNDTLQLTNTNQSTVALPDTIAGIAIGDVLDVSGLLKTTAGYTSLKTAEVLDTGFGFIELKNLVLTNPTSTTTQVKFDIALDAQTYGTGSNNKITGLVVDLSYDATNVTTATVSSITIDGVSTSEPTYPIIQKNLVAASNFTGKIAATVTLDYPNALIIDSSNKALSVTLNLNEAKTSFTVGLEGKSTSPAGVSSVTTAAGSYEVDVGIPKTARLAGSSSSAVVANTLEVVKDTGTLGTVTDNQFRYVETVNADGKTGTIQFQYDTNAAVGTPTLSDIVKVNLISADNLATFFAADHYKVI